MNEVPGMFRTWKEAARVMGLICLAFLACIGIVAAMAEVVQAIIAGVRS